jgi:hypothetical protein
LLTGAVGRHHLHGQAVLDIFFGHLLYFLTMAGGNNKGENATAPSGAKKPNYYI